MADRKLDVRNPRTGEIDYAIPVAGPEELRGLAVKARAAQPAWQAAGADRRCAVLAEWTGGLVANRGRLQDALAADTGRRLISFVEIASLPGMVARWQGYAAELLADGPERPSAAAGIGIKKQLVPYPLVGVIGPWNFPLLLSMLDAVPALVAGCAVLIKPSEVTPRFVEPLRESVEQFPELAGVLQFVTGDGSTGAALIEQVDAIAFTGSVPTGRKVAEACAANFIPAFLELGGKDPAIVLPSADPRETARIALRASVQATGQACQSLERLYVHDSIHDEFVAALVEFAEGVELSYPDADRGQLGPLIFARQAEIIGAHLDDARSKGAKVLCGGEIEEHGGGKWIRPTVVTNVSHDMLLMREETFGPVMPVMAYQTIDEAVSLANDTRFGLSAAVFGTDSAEAEAVARRLDAGAVSINDGALTVEVFDAEHNSFNLSGLGASRCGKPGLERFLRQKALMIRHSGAQGVDSLDEARAPA